MSRMESFKRSFKAWWDGVDLPPVSLADDGQDAPVDAAPDPATAAPAPASTRSGSQPGATRTGERLWSLTRAELAEKMWGAHHHLPGGDALIQDLIKPFGLDSTQQLLDLHAGLGGAGRVVNKSSGAWVRGFEPAAELVEIAQKRLKKEGLHKHITVDGYDPEDKVPQNHVDAALLRDVLFTVHNKTGLFDALGAALKAGGMLAFTDYAARDGAASPGLQAWLAAEPQQPVLMTMGEVVGQLKSRGFQVRINEDTTDQHRETVLQGLQHLMDYLQSHEMDGETRRTVMAEIAIWRGRLLAFEHGLRMYRFFAIKK